jgi:hypothetical protein
MQYKLTIKFKPEFGDEERAEFESELDVDPLNLSPEFILGRFTGITDDQIIQLELNLTDVDVNYIGKKYKFEHLDRAGTFFLHRRW